MSVCKIAIFTTSRAEFGILSPLIQQIKEHKEFDYLLFVGGAHLDEQYGNTIQEIKEHRFKINGKFKFISKKNTSYALAKSVGKATAKVSKFFKKNKFDYICILGDRYELLSVVTNSILFKKPIIHIGGGENTIGSLDQQVRDMITKASHLHFTMHKNYKKNILEMKEITSRVYNVGSLAIDKIKLIKKQKKIKLFKELNLNPKLPTILLTYHPATLEFSISAKKQISNLFKAIGKFNFQVVVTSPNSDVERDEIFSFVKTQILKNKKYHFFRSLNFIKYNNLVPYCEFVIGNSSSGIIEVPYHKIPTINIGTRQIGRIRHISVVDTGYSTKSIVEAIKKSLSRSFKKKLENMRYEFGNGEAKNKILKVLKMHKNSKKLILKYKKL